MQFASQTAKPSATPMAYLIPLVKRRISAYAETPAFYMYP
jgi:hypothetical protein